MTAADYWADREDAEAVGMPIDAPPAVVATPRPDGREYSGTLTIRIAHLRARSPEHAYRRACEIAARQGFVVVDASEFHAD